MGFLQAAEICGCVGIIAEVSYEALKKRHDQGWVKEIFDDVEKLIVRVKEAKKKQEVSVSVVERWSNRIGAGKTHDFARQYFFIVL